MKTSRILPAELLAIGPATGTGVARDDATCEVRKDGDTIRLNPTGDAGRYMHQRGNNSGRSSGNYGINRLDNGFFEVVWSKPFCSVAIAPDGGISNTTQDCTDEPIDCSRDIGRRER